MRLAEGKVTGLETFRAPGLLEKEK
jgi:hypothetical protein